jgi:hypothetical protein
MATDKFERLAELGRTDKFWALRQATEFREWWRAQQARRAASKPNQLSKMLAELPPDPPLTNREAEDMVRLLIRYTADEIGEQRRDELLAWMDKLFYIQPVRG